MNCTTAMKLAPSVAERRAAPRHEPPAALHNNIVQQAKMHHRVSEVHGVVWVCEPNCQAVNHHSKQVQFLTHEPMQVLLHCECPTSREDGMHIHMHASPKVVRPRTALHNTTQQVLIVSNTCLRHQRQLNQSPGLPVVNCFCGVWRETACMAGHPPIG